MIERLPPSMCAKMLDLPPNLFWLVSEHDCHQTQRHQEEEECNADHPCSVANPCQRIESCERASNIDWHDFVASLHSTDNLKLQAQTTTSESWKRRIHLDAGAPTLLHATCSLNPPMFAVQGLLKAFPDATSVQDGIGCTPLHIVCSSTSTARSSNIVRLLMEHDSQAAFRHDTWGNLPIHWACSNNNSNIQSNESTCEVVRVMLESCPCLALEMGAGQNSRTPLAIVSEQYRTAHTQVEVSPSPLHVHRSSRLSTTSSSTTNEEPDNDPLWIKLKYLLWAAHGGSVTPSVSLGQQDNNSEAGPADLLTLHAALACNSPPIIIEQALKMHASQAHLQDEQGVYPLMYAAASTSCSKSDKNVIQRLLQEYSGAARVPNSKGQYPLHVGLQAGRTWGNGELQELFEASPSVVSIPDQTTGLYPFMTAATSHGGNVDTIFSLLRECPDLVLNGNRTKDTTPQDC